MSPDRVVSLKPRARTVTEDILRVSVQLDLGALDNGKVRTRVVGIVRRRGGGERRASYTIGFVEREAFVSREGGPYVAGNKGGTLCPVDTSGSGYRRCPPG